VCRHQALLERLGPDASVALYTELPDGTGKDTTHFNEYGGTVIAGLVTHGMAAVGLPAARYLRPTASMSPVSPDRR
jgi:hypothetical protein